MDPAPLKRYKAFDNFQFQGHSKIIFQEKDIESGGSEYIMLYVGLGMAAIGLVISFVGLGDKGFKTIELRLVGPSLLGCGWFLPFLQVLYCTLSGACKTCWK
jgi:hypothetical protein